MVSMTSHSITCWISISPTDWETERVLGGHETSTTHMGVFEKPPQHKMSTCVHRSEWVELSCFGEGQTEPEMFLQPVRGFDNAAYNPHQDWNYIVFPVFYVLKEG